MMKTTRRFVAVIALVVAATPAMAQLSPGGSFVDDDGNVHEGYIEAIRAEDITRGCNPPVNDRYCPDESVTRGEMAAFLTRALGLPPGTDHFDDDQESIFADDINALAGAGITKGCNPPDNDSYCPDDAVTRGQMAAFLVRAFDYTDPGSGDWFVDDDGSVFEADIDRLRQAGVTKGCNPPANDMYCPANPVRRDEMASFLGRALGLAAIVPPSATEYCVRPDASATPVREVVVTPGEDPTLADALTGAQPGDRIVLAAGVHRPPGGNLVIGRSGTPNRWIEVVAAPGTLPIVDLEGEGEFRISGSYVSLRGIDIRNGGGNNLHIAPDAIDVHHVHVADTVIHDLASGPGAAIKVNRNNPQNAGVGTICLEGNDVSGSIDNALIDGVGVAGAVVVGNDIHDNDVGSHGIFFKGGSSDILIDGNLIRGIRGNAALQLGGNTGASFWNPDHNEWEGVNQTARNNIVADFDDSAVEIRGVDGAYVYNNTIVTQSSFAIFRLQNGNNASGGSSGNDNVRISSNLVVGTGGDPQYARNDAGTATIVFGPQLWAGTFHNSGSSTPGIPVFPRASDVVVGSGAAGTVIDDPTVAGLTGLADAIARYTPVVAGPAIGAAEVVAGVVRDIVGAARSSTAPTMGAIENP
jgi:hypothetical protein